MKDDRLLEMSVFKTVVDTGGFTAAAQVLGVSQPFVSQTITSLERRLNVQLLHRSTRMQRLTHEGEIFLESCRSILDSIEEAESRIVSAEPTGDLRVSAPLAFGSDQVVPLLPSFLARNKRVRVHLSLSDACVNLIEDNVDVAVRMGKLQDSSLMSRKLCNLQRIVVAAPAYVAAHGAPVTPDGLERHNCLMWHGPLDHLNRWPFVINGEAKQMPVRGNFMSSDGMTLFQMCIAGAGVMRLAEHLAVPAIRSGALLPLLSDYQAADDTAIHALFVSERQLVPRIRAFVDYLVEVFRQPPWAGDVPGGAGTPVGH